jgi:hypothetical protein
MGVIHLMLVVKIKSASRAAKPSHSYLSYWQLCGPDLTSSWDIVQAEAGTMVGVTLSVWEP